MKYVILPLIRLIQTLFYSLIIIGRIFFLCFFTFLVFLYHLNIEKTKYFIIHSVCKYDADNMCKLYYYHFSLLHIGYNLLFDLNNDNHYYYKNPIHYLIKKKTYYIQWNNFYYVAPDSLTVFKNNKIYED